MKVINLILSCSSSPWIEMEQVIRDTYIENALVTRLFYREGIKTCTNKDVLFIPVPEAEILTRTLAAFKYLISNYEFDYIFRSNTSSYINYDKYIDYLEEKKPNYAGFLGSHKRISFCSGCGYTLSRKSIEQLLTTSEIKTCLKQVNDDVILALLLKSKGIHPENAPRFDINEHTRMIPLEFFHYRCKPLNFSLYTPFITEAFKKLSCLQR